MSRQGQKQCTGFEPWWDTEGAGSGSTPEYPVPTSDQNQDKVVPK